MRMLPVGIVVMVASAGLVMACGGSTNEAKAPAVATAAPMPQTTATSTSAKGSSESAIAISKDILQLCGISADEAYFPFDSTSVVPTSVKPLKEVASCFSSGPLKGRSMKIIGHADPRGDGDYNFALGQRRADAVASYLQGVGMKQGQLSTTSRGAMDATGTDEPTWAKDRRVDLLLGS